MNATVKTFRASDPRSALAAVKATLGETAVIVSTRQVSGGLIGRPQIEVTAASAAEVDTPPGAGSLEAEVSALRRVVQDLRKDLDAGKREPPRAAERVPPSAVRLLRRLLKTGIEPAIAEDIARASLADAAGEDDRALFTAARAQVARRLTPGRAPWEGGGRQVVALVGPTGVGKTTTIAKIAARALLEARLRVVLLTVDTYRIGASEHLGRYAEIMGLRVQVARDAAAVRELVARAAEADLVLIDTAGRSDPAALAAQADVVRAAPDVHIHLLLSAASGAREARAAARRLQVFRPERLAFSKLDEAEGPGSVLSAAAAVPAAVSCFTNGQRVPDDLHGAAGLVDLVLGT